MPDETPRSRILVVDDTDDVRELLRMYLMLQGHVVSEARNGRQALEKMHEQTFDLVLLDIMMPEMNGYEVLEQVRQDPVLREMPIVVISAIHDLDSVVRCIELGAADYLPKPFKNVLLRARVNSLLEKKRMRDQEKAYLRMIEEERARSESLLLNILPAPVAERLKAGESVIADSNPDVTVLFADLVDFTSFAGGASPTRVVEMLNRVFSAFDELVEKHGLEKVKTTGDSYMVVGGLNQACAEGHVRCAANLGLDMCRTIRDLQQRGLVPFELRVGMHTGPVVAGVIGKQKFSYDLWGDTVNVASRMETQGVPGYVQVSLQVYERLREDYDFQERGMIEVKGKGVMKTYLLVGVKG